jgi:hypothetical protein
MPALLALAALASLAAAAAGHGVPAPRFSAHVTNPWFSLPAGRVLVYRGMKDGKAAREVMTVTHATKTIDGAPCVVVRDLLYLGGHLEERTQDWYSQDAAGNVWYFGEATAELDEHGRVTSTEGSWRAGVGGARPGIFMPAHPLVGQTARQEYLRGAAEDHFRVLSLHAPVSVPYVHTRNALLTEEWTPLEPGVLDHKLYVRGIGTVLEQTVKGGSERNALVAVR